MIIEFTGKFGINSATFGIDFEAKVDGNSLPCAVSTEALQDVDPSMAQSSPVDQFKANRARFEEIARRKIQSGRVPVSITTADLK